MTTLITGGAGSIGSEVVRHLSDLGEPVRVMDINEEGLWSLACEIPDLDIRLGDVQYIGDVERAMDGCSRVVHCAAYKHVHLCEASPEAAYRVNVMGTMNVMKAAEGRRVVLLSTDKASQATSVMGQTKRTAEWVITSSSNACYTRFGNVIGSRGSLVPAVIRYRDMGRAIPLTDPDMTRFFITIEDALGVIMRGLECRSPGYVALSRVQLRSARIGDFLEVCRDIFAPGLPIEEIGARPGESTHESMMTVGQGQIRSDDPDTLMEKATIRDLLQKATSRDAVLRRAVA